MDNGVTFGNTPLGFESQLSGIDSLVGNEILFVDAGVKNYLSFVEGVSPGTEVVVLDAQSDGIAQISSILAERSGISAIHVVSHGGPGSVQLGSTTLSSDTLDDYSGQLQGWASSLTEDADLLFYGCNVAAGVIGAEFVAELDALTGAEVAASDDLTGHAALGGDWELEAASGSIEADLAFEAATLNAYDGTLATFNLASAEDVTGDDVVTFQVNGSNTIEYSFNGGAFTALSGTINTFTDLTIDLGTGTDTVIFQSGLGNWADFDGNLMVGAETITLDSITLGTTSTAGDLDFNADAFGTTDATTAISINDSIITATSLSLDAISTVTHSSTSGADLNITNDATAFISGGSIIVGTLAINATTTGVVSSTAESSSIVDVVTSGDDGSVLNTISESARAYITGASLIDVTGAANLSALSTSSYTATGLIAENSLTGAVSAYIENTTDVNTGGSLTILAQDDATLSATSAADTFVSIEASTFNLGGTIASAQNSFDRATQAYIDSSTVTVTSDDLSINAVRDVNLTSDTQAITATTSGGFGNVDLSLDGSGTLSTNQVVGDVLAYIDDSTVETATSGDIAIAATDTSAIDARSEGSSFSISEDDVSRFTVGDAAVATSIAFNALGWDLDFGTETIDTLLGTEIGTENSLDVAARITNSTVDAAGDLSVTATSETVVNSTVSNTAETTSDTLFNSRSLSVASILASNKVSGTTEAVIDNTSAADPSVNTGGHVTLTADDSTTIAANTKLVSTSSTTNDGGISNLNDLADDGLSSDFSTESGNVTLAFGERVRLADDYAVSDFETQPSLGQTTNVQTVEIGQFVTVSDGHTAGGTEGSVYRYLGGLGSDFDLNTQDYSNTAVWAEVGGEAGRVYEYLGSGSEPAQDLDQVDYSDSDFWKLISATSFIPEGNNVTDSDAVAVGGVVVRNEIQSDVEASINEALVTTTDGDVTLLATENAAISAEADSTAEASGGSAYGTGTVVAAQGTIATNRILSTADAFITNSTIDANDASGPLGNVEITAQNTAQIDAETLNAASSGDTAFAIALAFNTIGWDTTNIFSGTDTATVLNTLLSTNIGLEQADPAVRAYIDNATVTADGDVDLSADASAQVNANVTNEATSAASALIGASGMAIGAVLASNLISSEAQAYIGDDPDNITAGTTQVDAEGNIRLTAVDDAIIDATSTITSVAATSNDAGVSILDNFIDAVLTDYDYTTKSGTRLVQENELVLIASDDEALGTVGSVYEYTGSAATLDLGAQDYDSGPWREITTDNLLTDYLSGLNFSDSDATSIGGLIVRNDVRTSTDSFINLATVTANTGDITVSATENANIQAASESLVTASGGSAYGTGTVIAVNGTIANNLILSDAQAFITNSAVTATAGSITIDAQNTAQIDATMLSSLDTGDTGFGVSIAFNTVGWADQNLFNLALSTLLTTPFGTEEPAQVRAFIEDATVSAGTDITVNGLNTALINSTLSNAAVSTASALFGASGMSIQGALVNNRVSSQAEAFIADTDSTTTDVNAGGNITVAAEDNAGIFANNKTVSSASTTNDGGAAIADDFIDDLATALLEDDGTRVFSTTDGRKNLVFGDLVQLGDDYAVADFDTAADFATTTNFEDVTTGDFVEVLDGHTAGGSVGSIYIYVGADATLDLVTEDFTTSNWIEVGGTAGTFYQYLGTETTGAATNLSIENYANLDFWIEVPISDLVPQGNNISDSDATAVGGTLVVNDVRADVTAHITDASVTAATGNVAVTAQETATIQAVNDSIAEASGGSAYGSGDVIAVNGLIASNLVLGDAQALIDNSVVEATTGDITVAAENSATITADTLVSTTSGDQAYSGVLAFNTVGWELSELGIFLSSTSTANITLNLLGDPGNAVSVFDGIDTAMTTALILDSDITAGSDLTVEAHSTAQIQAEINNESTSAASALVNANGQSATLLFSSNKVISSTDASIQETGTSNAVNAGGSITVEATDAAGIDADISLLSESTTTNDAGLGQALSLLNNIATLLAADYQFTTNSGEQTVEIGDKIYLASDYSNDGAEAGSVYIYTGDTSGDNATLDLGTVAFATTNSGDWELVDEEEDVLGSIYDTATEIGRTNVTDSNSLAVGGVIAFNDVRGNANASIEGATVTATTGNIDVMAQETAIIDANNASVVFSDGGSITGGGFSIAVNGVIASNVVLSEADAHVVDSDLTLGGTLLVDAQNTASLTAIVDSDTSAKGVAVGAILAFNALGTNLTDLLATAVDSSLDTETTDRDDSDDGEDDLDDSVYGSILDVLTVNPITVKAYVDNSSVLAGGAIDINAISNATILADQSTSTQSFDISFNNSTAVTFAANLALNFVETDTQAYIETGAAAGGNTDSIVAMGGDITIDADNTSSITADVSSASLSVAVGTGTSVSVGVGASIAVNDIDSNVLAEIRGPGGEAGTPVTASGDVLIAATGDSTLDVTSIASALSVSASGGGNSLGVSGAGALAFNDITTDIEATISDGADVTATNVGLTATDTSAIVTDAGGYAIAASLSSSSSGAVSIGVSVAENEINNSVRAAIAGTDTRVDASGTVDVTATTITAAGEPEEKASEITAQALAGGVAVGLAGSNTIAVAGSGAVTLNTINNTIEAVVEDEATLIADGDIQLTAEDQATITADAGSVAASLSGSGSFAAGASVGLGIAENTIDTTTQAYIDNATVQSTTADINLQADSEATIDSLAASIAGAFAVSGNVAVALAGAGADATNTITSTTAAYIQNDSDVDADGTLSVTALDNAAITADVGSLAFSASGGTFSASVSIGVTLADNDIRSNVLAYIGQDSAAGTDTTTVNAGSIQLNADSTSEIETTAIAVSAAAAVSIGGSLAGGGANATNNTAKTVAAFIRNGSVVATDLSAIDMTATDRSTSMATVGSGGFSAGLIGGSVGVSLVDTTVANTVQTYIEDATVSAATDLTLNATSTISNEGIGVATAFSLGLAGAFGGAGAEVTTNENTIVESFITDTASGDHPDVSAQNVSLTALKTVDANYAEAFGLSASLGTGLSLAVGVAVPTANLGGAARAYISGADVDASDTVTLDASVITPTADQGSDQGVFANAIGVGVSAASVAVSTVYTQATVTIDPTIETYISDNAAVTATNNIALTAESQLDGLADVTGISAALGSLGFAVNATLADIDIDPDVSSSIQDANVTAVTGNISLESAHNFDTSTGTERDGYGADSEAAAPLTLGITGAGTGADADATSSADVSTYVDSGAILSAGSDINVESYAFNAVNADASGLTIGLVLGAGTSFADATASGTTQARMDGSVTDGNNLTLLALDSSDSEADATANGGGIVSGQGATATATNAPNVTAGLGDGTNTINVELDNDVEITAVALGNANADSGATSLGVVSEGSSEATANWQPTVLAELSGGSTSLQANNVTVQAFNNYDETGVLQSANEARATADAVSGGVVGEAGATGTVNTDSNVQAKIGAGVDLTTNNNLDVLALSRNKGGGNADGAVGGVVSEGTTVFNANLASTTQAYAENSTSADATRISSSGNGTIQFLSDSDNEFLDSGSSPLGLSNTVKTGSGGALADSGATATVQLTSPLTEAAIGNHVTIDAGNATVNVTAENNANLGARGNGEASGVVTGSDAKAVAQITDAQTNANVGDDVTITADEFTLLADDASIQVRADAVADIGAVGGDVSATTNANADLNSSVDVGTNSTITAPTKISIQATATDVRTRAYSFSNAEALGADIDADAVANKVINTNINVDGDGSELATSELEVLAIAPNPNPNYGNLSVSASDLENVWFAETAVTDATILGTLVDIAEGACEVVDEVVGWGARVIGVDEPDLDCDIDNPEVDENTGGSIISTSDITFNADITVLNNDDNPVLDVDAAGIVQQLEGLTATNDGNTLSVGSSVDPNNAIVVDDITNESVGTVRFQSNYGGTSGFSNINYDTAFASIDIVNATAADLIINNIDPFPNNTEADVQVISNNQATGWDYEISTQDNDVDLTISNTNTAGGDVSIEGEIFNPLGVTTINSSGGNITAGTDGLLYTFDAFLTAAGTLGVDTSDRFPVLLVVSEGTDVPGIQQASGNDGAYLEVFTRTLNDTLTTMNIEALNLESANGDVDVLFNEAEVVTVTFDTATSTTTTNTTVVDLNVDLGAANAAGNLIVVAGDDDTVSTNVTIVDTLTAGNNIFLTVVDTLGAAATTELVGAGAVLEAAAIATLDTELDHLEAIATHSGLTILNTGGLTIGQLTDINGITAAGDVSITTSGPLYVFEDINAEGGITLTATDDFEAADADLSVEEDLVFIGLNASVASGGDVALLAGDRAVLNTGSSITATGALSIEVDTGDAVDEDGGAVVFRGEINVASASAQGNNDTDVIHVDSLTTNVGWTLQGFEGEDDVVLGSTLDDTITTTDGDDLLEGNEGDDALTSNDGDDVLRGGEGADTLDAGAGDDSLEGGDGNDSLIGGADNDTLQGGAGSDTLQGGTGIDTVDYSTSTAGVTIDISTTPSTGIGGDAEGDLLSDFENIVGSDFADLLTGSADDNELTGNTGNDTIVGGAGQDLIRGGGNDDELQGGSGNDTLYGDSGEDTLTGVDPTSGTPGQSSIDELYGGEGNNVYVLGSGSTYYYDDGNNTANGQSDYALIYGFTNGGGDVLRLASGFTYYLAAAPDDTLDNKTGLYVESNGIEGFGETDELIAVLGSVAAPDLPLQIEITDTSTDFDYTGDTSQLILAPIEGESFPGPIFDNEIQGSTGNDSLRGTGFNDLVVGGEGNDTLLGLDGNDSIEGNAGADRLYGHDGNDTLEGGADNDLLFGGNDADLLHGGAGDDNLIGGSGDDTLIGVDENSATAGQGEIDRLRGQAGSNTFVLGANGQAYYNDGNNGSNGQTDYALILDFDATQDFIQLANGFTYYLGTAPTGIGAGSGHAAIYIDNDGDGLDSEDELIAVLYGITAPASEELITAATLGFIFDD